MTQTKRKSKKPAAMLPSPVSTPKGKAAELSSDSPDSTSDSSSLAEDAASLPDTTSDELDQLKQSLDPKALAAERAAQLAIIQQIMAQSAASKALLRSTPDRATPTRTEDEAQPGKRRKLVVLPPEVAKQQSGWQPVQRFDPSQPARAEAPPKVDAGSLKDMFKPQEAQGFSFADALADVELEEEEAEAPAVSRSHVPPARAGPSRFAAPAPPQTQAPPKPPVADPDAPLFFPLCLDDPADAAFLDGLGLSQAEKERLESRSWTSGAGARFRRLGTLEEIEAAHAEKRGRITEQVKKRHREAVRAARRRTQL